MRENGLAFDQEQDDITPFTTANYLENAVSETGYLPDKKTPRQPDSRSRATELLSDACAPDSDRSPYLVQRLIETKERNLFNHVKFNLVKREIDKLGLSKPRIADIGCGLQVAHTYLSSLDLKCDYFGIDYEPNFHPDAVVDLLDIKGSNLEFPWSPDVLLMLDVLEHLHEDERALQEIVHSLSTLAPSGSTMIFTLPQMYRLDRFKLQHLHYPEHKIRLTQREWTHLIGKHFTIRSVSGFGFLSVIPYLPMASKRYTPDNKLGKLFNYLRGKFFEYPAFKPTDLVLSKALGQIPLINGLANDIMIIATPKRA
ncbi:MAG: class I SAM-dependent methyltransferase [Gammaproteobacteria bacterium]|nr:class I SAM-dependent methyltransferase [Gammaproteobacteria bacterium]